MAWHAAADIADLAARDVIGREVAGRRLALYRLGDGYHATADLCTHGQACLSEGEVVDGYIECPAHFGLFAIATGEAQGAPVTRDIRVYPVRLSGTTIEVEIDGC